MGIEQGPSDRIETGAALDLQAEEEIRDYVARLDRAETQEALTTCLFLRSALAEIGGRL